MRRPLSIILLLSLPLLGLAACADSEPVATAAPTPVRVMPATSGPSTPPIDAVGQIATGDEMRLSFKVGGVIRRLSVQAGDRVKKGQLLAEIELAEVGAQVAQARAGAAKAERDQARGARLYADQVISLEQLQDLRTAAAVATAGLSAAQFNLGYSKIVAPTDAVVLQRLAEEREQVPPGQTVLVLGALDSGYIVRAALADREIVQLRLGDPATVRTDAYPDQQFTGKVSLIANAAEPGSGLFPIEVQLDAPGVALATGLVAKIELSASAGRNETLTYVPIGAVVEGQRDLASVFLARKSRAERRSVKIAFIANGQVAIASGVAPGDPIITDGAPYLEDGEAIRIVDDAAGATG